MSRYEDVIVKRKAPFIVDVSQAQQLLVDLVQLRERFMRIGMIQTFHALDTAQLKAGFELADHIRLVQTNA